MPQPDCAARDAMKKQAALLPEKGDCCKIMRLWLCDEPELLKLHAGQGEHFSCL